MGHTLASAEPVTVMDANLHNLIVVGERMCTLQCCAVLEDARRAHNTNGIANWRNILNALLGNEVICNTQLQQYWPTIVCVPVPYYNGPQHEP